MESRSFWYNLCNDVSLVAMDLPSKMAFDLGEVMADANLDDNGIGLETEREREMKSEF